MMEATKVTKRPRRIEGTIKSFDPAKRQGLITREGERDLYIHQDALVDHADQSLAYGDRVEYEIVIDPKGTRAASVRRI